MAELLRRAVLGPETHVLFVGTDQQALALLAQVILAVAVRDGRQAPVEACDLGDGLGHEILVFRRQQRQCDAGQRGHLAPPEACGVDHPSGVDIALLRAHDPRAVGLLFGARDGAKADDLSAVLARARGIGVGDARRIDVAAVLLVHDAADAVVIDQRMQRLGLRAVDLAKGQPVVFRLGRLQAQLMLARFGLREIERAGLEHAAALARLRLERVVKVHGVVLDAGDVVVVVQPVDVGRRVPGAARCQLIAFQQHHIRPAQLGQVIEDRAADDAASDDDGLGMGAHGCGS